MRLAGMSVRHRTQFGPANATLCLPGVHAIVPTVDGSLATRVRARVGSEIRQPVYARCRTYKCPETGGCSSLGFYRQSLLEPMSVFLGTA